jgi:ZIP family zinc transporter
MALLLGFAGGIMIALSVFQLMPEALGFGSLLLVVIGFLAGCVIMFAFDRILPHAHMSMSDDLEVENPGKMPFVKKSILRTGYLIFFGIALHNIPEGFAIGVGLKASPELGGYIAVAIGLHNIPEGIAVAGSLKVGGMSNLKLLLFTFGAGMTTVLGTAIGLVVFNISSSMVSISLAFAAGAMFYIVNDELLPSANGLHSHMANAGLIAGLLIGFSIS